MLDAAQGVVATHLNQVRICPALADADLDEADSSEEVAAAPSWERHTRPEKLI
jgi:hypothetical protein